MAGKLYSENHRVTYYEVNLLRNATLSHIVDMIDLASEDQIDELGIGIDKVISMGNGWVVVQYDMDINRLPKVNENVQLQTRATSYNKHFAYREFWIRDQLGNELVHVGSLWVMMDLKTRKMVRIKDEAISPFASLETKRIERLRKIPKLSETEDVMKQDYHVRFSDIDWNGHVNNSHYIEWMIDVLSFDFLSKHEPTSLSIKFEDEVNYGDNVESTAAITETDGDNLTTVHRVSVGGKEKAISTIKWKEIEEEIN